MKFFVSILTVAAMTLAGCAFFKSRYGQKPEVKLYGIYLQDATLVEATVVFVLNVKNPNKMDLNIDDVDYEVLLDGKSFAKAEFNSKTKIPAEGEAQVQIPMPLNYAKLIGGLGGLLSGQDVNYNVTGKAKVSGFSVSFDEKGKINLRDLQQKRGR